MSSSVSQKLPFDPDDFVWQLKCPVSCKPLTNAVCLPPCMRKIDEAVAQKMFGPMMQGELKQAKACPFCYAPLKGYYPDLAVRAIAQMIFGYAGQPISSIIDNFSRYAECPVDLEPLLDAVVMFPCLHKVNEVVARKMFSPMAQGELKQAKTCSECRAKVTAYYPDHDFRKIVKSVFASSTDIETALTMVLSKGKEIAKVDFGFSGLIRPVKLRTIINDWDKNRLLVFETFSAFPPLLKEMVLFGREDGGLFFDLVIDGRRKDDFEIIVHYFTRLGIPKDEIMPYGISLLSSDQIRAMFSFISFHYEVPEEQSMLIRRVIDAGHWKPASKTSQAKE